jgi:very-short-patch-repair endonuclease
VASVESLALTLEVDARHARFQRQQRAGLRERRTLRAAPVVDDVTRGGASRSLRPGGCAQVAAPGTLPALEAQMRVHSSANRKSQARLERFALQHRFWPTKSEACLWSALKARQLGVSFRRQVPLGGRFIGDFFAPSIGLVVEVDGAYHARRLGLDARRDLKLRRLGFRVVRVSARLVLGDLPAAAALIRAAF